MLIAMTHEDGPSTNWLFFGPSICSMKEESMASQLSVVAASPLLARTAACVLTSSTPHLKW
jgi:hypothetical protein